MMKKTFKAGDKVFAKVKGYPAWPAKVESVAAGKKYHVKFYGTGETGVVKPEDLFYFLSNKPNLVKAHKRKYYNEALQEIEADIAAAGGTDGDGVYVEPDDSVKSGEEKSESGNDAETKEVVKVDKSTPRSQSKKRKVNTNDTLDESPKKLKLDSKVEKLDKDDSADETHMSDESIDKKMEATVSENRDADVSKIKPEEVDNKKELHEKTCDLLLIPENYLLALKEYHKKILQLDAFKDKTPDPVSIHDDDRPMHIPVKLPSGTFVALKFNTPDISNFDSEIARAEAESKVAENLLDLKKSLDSGTKDIESVESTPLPTNLDESDIERLSNTILMNCKEQQLSWMKHEASVYQCLILIKRSLGLDKADPNEAIKQLELMLTFNLEPLIFKKHPQFVDTFRRLQKYIGNTKKWQFSKEEEEKFNESAQIIRDIATTFFGKLKTLFNFEGSDVKFLEHFKQTIMENYNNVTKDLTESQKFSLFAEPDTRRAVLSQVLESLGTNTETETTTS